MSGNRRTAAAIFVILLIFAIGVWISGRLALRGDGLLAGRAVAILPIEGVITSERRVLANLESLRENGAVRAFVVEIRSPGGTVGASCDLRVRSGRQGLAPVEENERHKRMFRITYKYQQLKALRKLRTRQPEDRCTST